MIGTRYIVAGGLIDGSGAAVRKNVFLAVEGGVITDIGSAKDIPADDKDEIDDLSHGIILPPLVDCSVYLLRSPALDMGVAQLSGEADEIQARMIEQHIGDCHAHGVMGVAESDDVSGALDGDREDIWPLGIINIRVPGRDYLKVQYSSNIEDDQSLSPHIDQGELCCILQQQDRIKAVVVANGPQQVCEALEAGCEAIEQGYRMGKENLRMMADNDVLWVPNLLRAKNSLDAASSGGSVCCRFSTRYVAPGKPVPGAEALWKNTLDEQLTQLRLAREIGVKTAVGTGAGSIGILHGESMAEEMKLFIKAGYSLEETVQCASENGARFFDIENIGTLKVGQKASFLLTRGSVKQLPRKLSYLEGIYVNGLPSVAYHKNHS